MTPDVAYTIPPLIQNVPSDMASAAAASAASAVKRSVITFVTGNKGSDGHSMLDALL